MRLTPRRAPRPPGAAPTATGTRATAGTPAPGTNPLTGVRAGRSRWRPLRLLAAAVLAGGLAVAAGSGNGGLPTAGAAPAAPGPAGSGCAPGDGIVITDEMAAAVALSDDHETATPAGGSVTAGCGHQHTEDDSGWTGTIGDDAADPGPAEDDGTDPFAPSSGGQPYLYLYQLDDFAGGLPDYWEPPTALHIADWSATGNKIRYVWRDANSGVSRSASLPVGTACTFRGPVPAAAAPGRVRSYERAGHPRIYLYDHVPLALAAFRMRGAGGGWYHYLCGAATPAGIAGPGNRLTATEADYYSTPHWVYARGWSGAELDQLSVIWRVARSQAEVYDAVRTSPAARSVVGLKVWMWGPAAGYDVTLGGLRARVRPTGIIVRAPGVPLRVHDLRDGGCRDGGSPDTGDATADTDCWFAFDRATGTDPTARYSVGLALRWSVSTETAGGAPVGRPMTFWTTSVRQFQVGEVQVPVR